MERRQRQVDRLVALQTEVDAHGTPPNLAAKVTNLHGFLDEKENALEKAKTNEDTLSSKFTAVEEALEKDREIGREHVESQSNVCDDYVDKGINGVFDVFGNVYDQVEVLRSGIQIPEQHMHSEKRVFNGYIISDNEDI